MFGIWLYRINAMRLSTNNGFFDGEKSENESQEKWFGPILTEIIKKVYDQNNQIITQ